MSGVASTLFFMAALTDDEIRILELAERLEGVHDSTGKKSGIIVAELRMSPARFTQQLMHLVQDPSVIADPRWTAMAYRIQKVMTSAKQLRASRLFLRAS